MFGLQFIGDFSPCHSRSSHIEIIHWDGMIYNRRELCSALSIANVSGAQQDSKLLHAAIERWHKNVYKHLEGRYLLIYRINKRLYAARGVYDSPELFYSCLPHKPLLSLDIETLLHALPSPIRLDSSALIHQLSFSSNLGERTPFRDLCSLEAGQAIDLTSPNAFISLPAHAPFIESTLFNQEDTSKLWRDGLSNTVRELSSYGGEIGLLLSGGLDSGAIACMSKYNDIPLKTITFGLTQHPQEDESKFAASLARDLNFEHHHVEVQSQCFQEIETCPITIRRPAFNPYQRMMIEGYQRASELGVRQLWTGSVGDDIYAPKRNILIDLWKNKKYKSLAATAFNNWLSVAPVQHLNKTLINHIIKRTPRDRTLPAYINLNKVEPADTHLQHPKCVGNERLNYHRSMIFHYDNLNGLANERHFYSDYGFDRIHPFMHPFMVELGLRTPSYQTHSLNDSKTIVRSALKNLAPVELLQRGRVGVLNDYFYTGWLANQNAIYEILFDRSASWPEFIEKSVLKNMLSTGSDESYMLASNCLALELWLNKLRAKGISVEFV